MKNNIDRDVPDQNAEKLPDSRKKIIWSFVSVAIAALTVWAVMSQTKNFSFGEFLEQLSGASPWWIATAVTSMIAYICFEALALMTICREFGHAPTFRHGLVYSSADLYFSAITPSATGGQPASAFFMRSDGMSTTLAAMVLIANLLMYTCSTVCVGLISTAIAPLTITRMGHFSRVLVIAGFAVQVFLLFVIAMLVVNEKIIKSFGNAVIRTLGRIRIIKNTDKLTERFDRSMDAYRDHTKVLSGKRAMMAKVLLFNILQRVSQMMVTVFTYIALGNPIRDAAKVFSLQMYISIGAYCIPIPGSMGVTDYLMIDGFRSLIGDEAKIVSFELLSRTLSFYSCIIICGLTVLVSYLIRKKRRSGK